VIVPIDGDAPDLVDRLLAARDAGDVPLIRDPRWPEAQWSGVLRAATHGSELDGVAWATVTSGSSGAPRVVLRSASSWEGSFTAIETLIGRAPDAAVALPAPPSSSLTLFSLAHAIAGGPRAIIGRADGSDATCLHGTPQALREMLERGAPPSLRTALIGGSHLDAALRARAHAAGIEVVSYYGAAELSFVAIDRGDGLRAFPGVELDVRSGRLWVRSPFVAMRYAGGAGPLHEEDGWATVGDRAAITDGVLRLRGRADDAILSASATIIPEEVEEVLRSVAGVRDAVVFALPRERVGALVAAFVELEPGGAAGISDIVGSQLAPTHRPRRWFVGELPRTPSGKPARGEAAERALRGEVARLVI
jgi:long-chain acyl-CoA synthetase